MYAEVVVIGAGVMGSSIALELGRSGRQVVVVDKSGGVGHGSTSASSAVVRFNFSTWAGVAAAWESRFCWENWADHLGVVEPEGLVSFVRSGLALLDVEVAPRGSYLPFFDRAGIAYEEWDAETLARRIAGLDAGRFWPPKRIDDERFWDDSADTLGAVYTPEAGYVNDPQRAAANLADVATRHGVRFLVNRAVTDIRSDGGRVSGVTLADGTRIDCDIVVNAAGPWSGRINRLAGVGDDFTISVRPMRQEVHHVAAPPGYSTPNTAGIAIADMDLGVYIRGETGGGMLIGGTEPECDPLQWIDDPDGFDLNPTQAVFEAQVTRAARRLSTLTVPNRPKGVAGVYDVTDDWTPIYDKTALPGFYVAMGTSGNQFKNAPIVGQFLTAIIDHSERGFDHDTDPVQFTGKHTGHTIDLSVFSRRRPVNENSSGTVMG